MTLHEAFVDLYTLLERTWVGHFPAGHPSQQCLLTGTACVASGMPKGCRTWTVETRALQVEMEDLLREVIGDNGPLWVWNDSSTKEEVLAAVAECIARTAPEPHVELEEPVEVVV